MQQRQQEMMKNLLIDLPEDLFINNILLSKVLPIKYLSILRCVCKYLRNLITSPAFIKIHLHHSTSPPDQLNNQLVLVDSSTTDYKKILDSSTSYYDLYYSLKFNDGDPCRPEVIMFDYPIEEDSSICGSCNGLLCLEGDDNRVCLWNPLTKEYKDLPPPLPLTKIQIGSITKDLGSKASSSLSITYGFSYDRFIDDYKIIRCDYILTNVDGTFHGHLIPITEFQVYILGTNTWKKIDNNPYKSYFGQTTVNQMQFVNGAFHMIMSKSHWSKLKKSSEAKIVTFDIENEVFGEMQWPLLFKLDYCCTTEIQVLRGCLCVLEFDKKENCCNAWMMMDYGVNESWTKLFTIVQNEVEYPRKYTEYYNLLRFCDNGDILIGTNNFLFFYDPINNKSRRVEFGESDMVLYGSEIYIESLVSLNTGVYKGKAEFQDEESQLIRAFGLINLD